jgi:hypothetical protein
MHSGCGCDNIKTQSSNTALCNVHRRFPARLPTVESAVSYGINRALKPLLVRPGGAPHAFTAADVIAHCISRPRVNCLSRVGGHPPLPTSKTQHACAYPPQRRTSFQIDSAPAGWDTDASTIRTCTSVIIPRGTAFSTGMSMDSSTSKRWLSHAALYPVFPRPRAVGALTY